MRRLLASLFVLGLVASASTAAESRVRSLLELRHDRVVIQEWDLSCGAAVVATLLTYAHHDPVSEREVAEGLIARPEYIANPELIRTNNGFSLLDLKRFVEGRGYRGIGYAQATLADLIELSPVVVPVRFTGYDHFVIFRGLRGNRVLLADPAWGNRTMPLRRFESSWLETPEFGRVAFVILGGDGSEPPDRLLPRPREFVR